MALNVTTAVFGSGCNTATAQPSLVQWDQGQVLKFEGLTLPSSYQVEFSGGGTMRTVPAIGDASGVEIPNALLQSSHPITAYIVLHEGQDDRETEYWATIYVKPRQAPQTTDPDPEQIDIIDQTIAALQDGVAAAEAAAESVQNMGVEAETLAEGSAAAVEKTVDPETGEVTLTFGIPKGTHGDPGYSPTIQIATITGGHRITVTDSQGSASFDVMDGEQGDPGAPGDDGYSPAVTITQITNGHRVTITDKTHQSGQTFDVMDGEQGDPGTPGDDGYSPAVTITTITGGHRVTITDKTHPSGQTFDVMDGVIQSVNGKSAASITLDSGDIEFDDSVTYAAGSIGAEVSNAKNAISQTDAKANYKSVGAYILQKILCPDFEETFVGRKYTKSGNHIVKSLASSSASNRTLVLTGTTHGIYADYISDVNLPAENKISVDVIKTIGCDCYLRINCVNGNTVSSTSTAFIVSYYDTDGNYILGGDQLAQLGGKNGFTGNKVIKLNIPDNAVYFCFNTRGTGSAATCDFCIDLDFASTALTENIAPIENGTTASKAYAQGAYFFHNDKFCKATTAIASGATFTRNTNYTETTVAAELLAAQN